MDNEEVKEEVKTEEVVTEETKTEEVVKEEVKEESKTEEKKAETEEVKGEETQKIFLILAYILFFIPLLVDGKNKEYKFHANQGCILLIFSVAVNIVGAIIPFIGWFIIIPAGNIMTLVFFIMGLINAANSEMKELPLIGSFKLIK